MAPEGQGRALSIALLRRLWADPRRKSTAWWALLVAFFVVLLLGSVLAFPKYLVDRTITSEGAPPLAIADRLKAENDVRTILLQGLGALVLLAGAVTTWLQLQATLARNREELRLSREGQVTERFTRAIEQLGSGTLDVQLGGIYALERIAKDSSRDHGPIMEVLTAFVRERALWKDDQPAAEHGQSLKSSRPDIQAILTVLGRRVINEKWQEPTLDLSETDLREANLRYAHLEKAFLASAHLEKAFLAFAHLEGAELLGAHLEGANLGGAHLEKASLGQAHLEDAYLYEAHLEGAILFQAYMKGAFLVEAHLEGANLSGAHLDGADLRGAHLNGAILSGAHLKGALHLTKEQIESAHHHP